MVPEPEPVNEPSHSVLSVYVWLLARNVRERHRRAVAVGW